MKSRIVSILIAAVVASGCLLAQGWSQTVRAEVPFGFTAGNVHFAAGEYQIIRLLPEVIRIEAQGTTARAALIVNRQSAPGGRLEPRLIFKKYGEAYFLSEVWTGAAGVQVPPSRREKDMAIIAARQATRVTLTASLGK